MSVLAHRVTGSGRPVLLLNGGLMTVAAWDPVAALLEPRRTVVRCDLRGQLLSPGPPPATLEGHVADVLALLDELRLPALDVVGTSYGGFLGILLAGGHPERVRSLVAATAAVRLEAADWQDAQPLLAAARAAAEGGDGRRVFDALRPKTFGPGYAAAHAALLEERRERFGRMPASWYASLEGLLLALRGLDLSPAAAAIRCPTLVLAAEHDATFPRDRWEALGRAIPGARVHVVPDAGHALVLESPERLVAALHAFWAKTLGEAA